MKKKEDEKITFPVTLNYNRENVVGELTICKKYYSLLWNMHLAPAFILKERDIKTGRPIRAEVTEFSLQADTQFTNWKGERFYSQSEVDEIVRKVKNAKTIKALS